MTRIDSVIFFWNNVVSNVWHQREKVAKNCFSHSFLKMHSLNKVSTMQKRMFRNPCRNNLSRFCALTTEFKEVSEVVKTCCSIQIIWFESFQCFDLLRTLRSLTCPKLLFCGQEQLQDPFVTAKF